MRIKANAKINKYLKILGKRNDGFHELESLFIPINIYDEINIEESKIDQCECVGIAEEENIAFKALKKFKEKSETTKSFKIIINKNIPSFAGLGGGSSDAAFVLKGLNELCDYPLTEDEMYNIALEIGSDVPFFLYNKSAIVTGRGENVKVIEKEDIYGVLVFDGLKFSTKDIFNNYDLLKKQEDCETYNDLERGVIEKEYIENVKKCLEEMGAYYASMTGSGSSVFGLFNNECETNKAYEEIKSKYQKVFVFKNIA